MSFITLDWETYYDREYSLSKLTTEEYINHKLFEIIGVGIKIDDTEPEWISNGPNISFRLAQLDWKNSALLCHNQHFDGAILAWMFNIYPAFYFDTLCMTRPINGVDASASLASLAQRYQIGTKGDEVVNAIGKHRRDFTDEQLFIYGAYCKNDVELTYKLFNKLSNGFPEDEYKLIDLTIRMFTQPVLKLNDQLLVDKLIELRESKKILLSGLKEKLDCIDEEEVRKKLASNRQFVELLKELGIAAPMKVSPMTGKLTYALAKNDEGFLDLYEYGDPWVQQLCAARIGTKSTMEETRIERFIGIGARNKGMLPVPLKYYAAHPGRWGGMDAVNLQNLPSRDKDKKTLKNSIVAPPGHVIINADSSQIEARILAWWAEQTDVVDRFRSGEDVYSYDASQVYARKITKADVKERFVGKTMRLGLGYGTGAQKLQAILSSAQTPVELTIQNCQELVSTWRRLNNRITILWNQSDRTLQDLLSWPEKKGWYWLGRENVVLMTPLGIKLPNDLFIRYPNLRLDKGQVIYDSRKGQQTIWGGTVVENVTQALARIVIGEQMLRVAERYKVALTVHDSIVCVVPEECAGEAVQFIREQMSRAPKWASDLPVACEVKMGNSYGDC